MRMGWCRRSVGSEGAVDWPLRRAQAQRPTNRPLVPVLAGALPHPSAAPPHRNPLPHPHRTPYPSPPPPPTSLSTSLLAPRSTMEHALGALQSTMKEKNSSPGWGGGLKVRGIVRLAGLGGEVGVLGA